MKVVTIDRAKWVNGTVLRESYDDSALKTKEGLMCCLGFGVNQACNIPQTKLVGVSSPESFDDGDEGSPLTKYLPRLEKAGFININTQEVGEGQEPYSYVTDSDVVKRLIKANDDPTLRPSVRERRVVAGFRQLGLRVRFIGKTADAIAKVRKVRGLEAYEE